jgi:hypothetical protein
LQRGADVRGALTHSSKAKSGVLLAGLESSPIIEDA